MSEKDRVAFRQAVAKAKSAFVFEDWDPVVALLPAMSMPDMLSVLIGVSDGDRKKIVGFAGHNLIGQMSAYNRVLFAQHVIDQKEIIDFGLSNSEVNDGREFLGCTRLDDAEVKLIIENAINEGKSAIREGRKGTEWGSLAGDKHRCCGAVRAAWNPILVQRRRAFLGASMNSNLASAAHYMLSRFHVCAAMAKQWQMDVVIDGYDDKKRKAIAGGDTDLKSMALTPGNRPFPPDFAIRNWARKGSLDGEADRMKCNGNETQPLMIPEVNGSDA